MPCEAMTALSQWMGSSPGSGLSQKSRPARRFSLAAA